MGLRTQRAGDVRYRVTSDAEDREQGIPASEGVTCGNNLRTTSRARSDAVRQKAVCLSGRTISDSTDTKRSQRYRWVE